MNAEVAIAAARVLLLLVLLLLFELLLLLLLQGLCNFAAVAAVSIDVATAVATPSAIAAALSIDVVASSVVAAVPIDISTTVAVLARSKVAQLLWL